MSVEIRGAAFHSFLEAVEATEGAPAARTVLEKLPAELRARLGHGEVTRLGFFPVTEYELLHEALHGTVGGGFSYARSLGRRTTEIDLRGIVRFVLAFGSPELLVRYADRVFRSYFRGTEILQRELAPRRHRFCWRGFAEAGPYTRAESVGSVGYLIEACGGRDVAVTPVRPTRRSDFEFEIGWS